MDYYFNRCRKAPFMSWRFMAVFLALVAVCFAEDRASIPGRASVSKKIEERTGHRLNPDKKPVPPSHPPGVSSVGPLTQDDAVAIALWNNAALQAVLANLGLARADLIEAGLLRNPSLNVLLPVGPKPFEFVLQAPVEAVWQRPRRVAAARLNLDQVAEGLVQSGLDLARGVKLAHADLEFAERRAGLARESADLRRHIAELTEKRLAAGDISEMEALVTRVDAQSFRDQALRYQRDVESAAEGLRLLLGLRKDRAPLSAKGGPAESRKLPELDAILDTALAFRPDLRAAELGIQVATQRARWERSRVLALLAPILSIKGVGSSGIRSGPGFLSELPVFQRNQGGIARADAEVERATLAYLALRDQIDAEIREARVRFLQEQESLERLQLQVLPAVKETIALAEKSYSLGNASYLLVLETTRQIYDARLREAEAVAGVRRAAAHLERGMGKNL